MPIPGVQQPIPYVSILSSAEVEKLGFPYDNVAHMCQASEYRANVSKTYPDEPSWLPTCTVHQAGSAAENPRLVYVYTD